MAAASSRTPAYLRRDILVPLLRRRWAAAAYRTVRNLFGLDRILDGIEDLIPG